MFPLSHLWHSFWFLRIALHSILLLWMIRGRLYKQFPTFALYTIWAVVQSVVLVAMNYAPFVSGDQYFAAYLAGRIGTVVLSFAVTYEIFRHVLHSYPALTNLGSGLLRGATVVLLMVAVGLAWLAPAAGDPHSMAAFYALDRAVNILLCGLLVFVFVFAGYFGLPWRGQVFGITLGMGILATVDLGTYAIRTQIEPIAPNLTTSILSVINQGTYLLSVAVWTVYLWAPETAHAPAARLPEVDLQEWNQGLRRLL